MKKMPKVLKTKTFVFKSKKYLGIPPYSGK
jgi:hypothetical protein